MAANTWVEKIKTKFSITMGDKKVYYPISMIANLSDEFNLAEFNFRNLKGTLIDRRQVQGSVYDLELYFQGGDNLDISKQFRTSSYNRNAWIIQHPIYGQLTVQPISIIKYDNARNLLNATKITVTVKETLNKSALIPTNYSIDTIKTNSFITQTSLNNTFIINVPAPQVNVLNQMKGDVSKFEQVLKNVSANADSIRYYINKAKNTLNNAQSTITDQINDVNSVLSIPALIIDTIANRNSYYQGLYNSLVSTFVQMELSIVIPNVLKQLWAGEAGACITNTCLSSVTNIQPNDYVYNSDVLNVISTIVTNYNDYITKLNSMQTATASETTSFIPDFTSSITLYNLVNLTIETLFDIAANSKQPRTIELTNDSNVIEIAYQIYGLLPDDSTIDKIIADNLIGLSELITVPKGREILYYV